MAKPRKPKAAPTAVSDEPTAPIDFAGVKPYVEEPVTIRRVVPRSDLLAVSRKAWTALSAGDTATWLACKTEAAKAGGLIPRDEAMK